MRNTFEILSRFLERYGDEGEDHALNKIPVAVKLKLREFAEGHLAKPDRGEMAKLLKANPCWVPVLASAAWTTRRG
jgi:hypothetical protein